MITQQKPLCAECAEEREKRWPMWWASAVRQNIKEGMITRHGISTGNFVVNLDWKELIAGNQQFLITGIKNETFFFCFCLVLKIIFHLKEVNLNFSPLSYLQTPEIFTMGGLRLEESAEIQAIERSARRLAWKRDPYPVRLQHWLPLNCQSTAEHSLCISFRNWNEKTEKSWKDFTVLYYYMRSFCNLIGLEQWYFSLIWNTCWKITSLCG